MKNVHYLAPRPGMSRVLRDQDFRQAGYVGESVADVRWDKTNKFTVVMSDELSDSVQRLLPQEFRSYDVNDSQAGTPQEVPNDSVSDGNGDDGSSTPSPDAAA